MGKIANAGGHRPANPDQDYQVQDWYYGNWDAVLRPTNSDIAQLSSDMAIAAANNNNVIYIFGGQTYHQRLAEVGYDPSKIQVQCGTDCMGTCFANIKGAMARLGLDNSMLPNMGTVNADALMRAGFQKFTDSDHVRTDAYAQRGDVYVRYSVHACMHVGDGVYEGGNVGSGVQINYEAMSPYVIRVPDTATSFNGDVFLNSQVSGVALSAGYLYSKSTHVKQSSYIALHLKDQVKCAKSYGIPFALLAEVRARSVAEAKAECEKLYYVCASSIPDMGLWLHLDMSNSVPTNERILEYYISECSKWGFKNSLGVYVDKNELKKVDWNKYSEDLYLWKVDHTVNVDDYVGCVPFATQTAAPSPSGGQEYSNANDKQRAIADACRSTPTAGEGRCAAWITNVYSNAGIVPPYGNACDMYRRWCKYTSKSDLKVGMLVAVSTHPHTSAGRQYGHVGIYVGDNKIMENVGPIRTSDFDWWVSYYGATCTPKWGFGAEGVA